MLIYDDNLICIVCYSCWDQYIGINTCGCLPCLFHGVGETSNWPRSVFDPSSGISSGSDGCISN